MRKNNKNINKNSFILESMMTFATLSLFGVGFSAWVHTGGGSIDNVQVSVGNVDTYNLITLDSYTIFETATIGSEKYYYSDETLSTTGDLTLNLVYHSGYISDTGTNSFNCTIGLVEQAIPSSTTLPAYTGCTISSGLTANTSLGICEFGITLNNTGEDVNFSLTFTMTTDLLNINTQPAFTLTFEVAS